MQVEDLYYKKYLKYKNKYLELKQYGGNGYDIIQSRIAEQKNEDTMSQNCKNFISKHYSSDKQKYDWQWPTPKIIAQRTKDATLLLKIKQMEDDDIRKNPNRYVSLVSYIDDRNIDYLNFDNKHTVYWKDIEDKKEGKEKCNNYIEACEFARNTFYIEYEPNRGDFFKWKIVNDITRFVMNYDPYYDTRKNGEQDDDSFYNDNDALSSEEDEGIDVK